MTNEELSTRFTYHPPRDGQPQIYETIRAAALSFATLINELTPESREQSLAFTSLDEVVFWANSSIARRSTFNTERI